MSELLNQIIKAFLPPQGSRSPQQWDEKYSFNDMYGRTLLKKCFFSRTYDSAFPFHEDDEPEIPFCGVRSEDEKILLAPVSDASLSCTFF